MLPRIRSAAIAFYSDNSPQRAASISYFALFSLFPLLMFLLSLLGLFWPDSDLQRTLIESVIAMIPVSHRQGDNLVISAIRQINEASGTVSLIGLAAMAWSASALFGSIRSAVNAAYRVTPTHSAVRLKLIDLCMVPAMMVLFFFSVVLTTMVEFAEKLTARWMLVGRSPWLQPLLGQTGLLWRTLLYSIPTVLTLCGFVLIYRLIPNTRMAWRPVWRGAILASLLFEACKFAFVFYLDRFARYDVVFGSLGTVAAFLVWIYLSSMILLFGAEFVSADSSGRL